MGDSSHHVSQNSVQHLIRILRPRFIGGRQNTVERPINFLCKRFVICSTSLDLIFWCGPESSSTSSSTSSLAAHILVLSLCMAKVKRGDDGGWWKILTRYKFYRCLPPQRLASHFYFVSCLLLACPPPHSWNPSLLPWRISSLTGRSRCSRSISASSRKVDSFPFPVWYRGDGSG
jgi:hypothetical protein